jgi:hypothetical protein
MTEDTMFPASDQHFVSVSKVTRHSPNAEVLRKQCDAAVKTGGFFSVVETWENNDWWSTYAIYQLLPAPMEGR